MAKAKGAGSWMTTGSCAARKIALSRELGMTPAARIAIKAGSTNAALDLVGLMAQQQSYANQNLKQNASFGQCRKS